MTEAKWFKPVLAFATLVYVGLFCVFLYKTIVRVPVLDQLDWVLAYGQTWQAGDWWSYLWQPHNEHRLLVTRLLLVGDIVWFGGSNAAFVIVGVLALAAIVWMLLAEVWSSDLRGEPRALLLAAVVFILTASHLAVLVSVAVIGCQLHTVCFVVLALVLMDGTSERRHPAFRRALAIVFAVLAPFGVAAGLLVWPVMLWSAWRASLGWRWIATIAAIGGMAWMVYLSGIPRPAHPPNTLATLFGMFDFAIRMLGLPWSRVDSLVWFGRIVGLFVLLAGSSLLVRATFVTPPTRIERIGTALTLFALLVSVAAGAARYGMTSEGGLPVRYGIFAALGQIGILFAAPSFIPAAYAYAVGRNLRAAALVVTLLLIGQQVVAGNAATKVTERYEPLWNLFRSGAWTPEMETFVHHSRRRAESALAFMRSQQLYGMETAQPAIGRDR